MYWCTYIYIYVSCINNKHFSVRSGITIFLKKEDILSKFELKSKIFTKNKYDLDIVK